MSTKEQIRARCAAYYRAHRMEILARVGSYQLEYRRRKKILVLTHYGKAGQLWCCWRGCSVRHLDMLTLDHVRNDGAQHRRISHKRLGHNIYGWIIKHGFPSGFQTLCANHQLLKELRRRRKCV